MFRKLFQRKPRLDADDPNDRIAAVAGLAANDQDAFARVLLNDGDRQVRLASLARLTKPEPLLAALADGDMAEAATQRLLAIIDASTPAAVRNHPSLLRAALVYAEDGDAALAAAARIEDVEARAAALADSARAEVRRTIGEAAWQPDFLAELAKSMRGRDKSVHRLASDRLALLKQANAERCQEDAKTDSIVAAAEALRDDDPHYDARRDTLERNWQQHLQALAETDGKLARFGVVAHDLNAIRSRFPVRRQPPKTERKAGIAEIYEPLLEQARALAEAIGAHLAAQSPAQGIAELQAKADALDDDWRLQFAEHPPGEAFSARFDERMALVRARLRMAERGASLAAEAAELLKQEVADAATASVDALHALCQSVRRQQADVERLLNRCQWPEDLPTPAHVAALDERRGALAAARQSAEARLAQLAEEIAAAIAELKGRMEDGALHDAVESDQRLRQMVRHLPPEMARPLNAELAGVVQQLRDLRDWRNFAEAPKRLALCEQVEQLAAQALPAHEQAKAVKALRQQWNELGVVDDRKSRELRKRFDHAAERAFEPCREHFKEQAQQRSFNLQQRQAIVAALEEFLAANDWDNADWNGVEKVLRQARSEWRQYHPTDLKAGRDLAKRFEQIADEIHGLLKEERERNIECKEALVGDAAKIRESGLPATEKADALKEVQRRWKEVGPTPRQADQRLWKQFRAECDVVFEARNLVRDQRAMRRRTIEEAESLISELGRRVDLDPILDRSTVADYEHRFEELGSLPNEVRRRADAVLRHAERSLVGRQARRGNGAY